jgi:hypothetical protein
MAKKRILVGMSIVNLKKNIIFVIVALLMVGRVFPQTGNDFEVVLTEDNEGVVITKFIGKVAKTITIPATIQDMPVKEIGESAFRRLGQGDRNTSGTPFTVVLPHGLTSIGDSAFEESALTSVVIPDTVTSIGKRAFSSCGYYVNDKSSYRKTYSLTSVTLPKGLTKVVSYIWSDGAFYDNSALKTVVIPEGCSVIGEGMFLGCKALTAITIPKSITSIPSQAFEDCTGLETLVIPEGVTKIEYQAFRGCTSLISVTLPSTITSIAGDDGSSFLGCSVLTTITIPDTVANIQGGQNQYVEKGTTLLKWAFSECPKLSLALQARLKKITVTAE